MPSSPHSHKWSSSSSGGVGSSVPFASSSLKGTTNSNDAAAVSSRPPPSSSSATPAVPLRASRSFSQQPNHAPHQVIQQQQRRRANYRAGAPPQSPKPFYHDDNTSSHHDRGSSHNAPPSPGRRIFSSSATSLLKTSSFDDCYNNTTGYSDAFALMGSSEHVTDAAPSSSPSRRKRFFPASPKKTSHSNDIRSPPPNHVNGGKLEPKATPPNLFMPNFGNAGQQQPPPPSTPVRSASPSMRASSPLTLKMKQSLPWKKTANRQHMSKGSGNYSDAVALALQQDSGDVRTAQDAKQERRSRMRSPSPVRYLDGDNNAADRKGRDDGVRNLKVVPKQCNRGESEDNSVDNLMSKCSRDGLESNLSHSNRLQAKSDDKESNASSSAAPSFFNNRNIRSMSPARLKMSLKQRIMDKVPSSPMRSSGNNDENSAVDGPLPKFAAASMSFDLDDCDVARITPNSIPIPEDSPVTPNSNDFLIDTSSYNILENTQFYRSMGGSNDASLATNYIRTGDALCSSEEGRRDRALPLYYAGLGAILTRIRKWSMSRGELKGSDDGVYNLVYRDFYALAQSDEMNVLLLAMSSILLKAGNVNFLLGRFETACRDYASANSYRLMRRQALGMSEEDIHASSLVDKSLEEKKLLLEDAKLSGHISNNFACSLTKRKLHEEARAEYTKALQIKQKTLDKLQELSSNSENESSNSVEEMEDEDLISDVASTFHNIGLLRVQCDEPKKAEKAFKQSLSLRVKKFGLDDLGVSCTLCALGDVYFHQKQFDDAFRSYKESLRIWKFHRGNNIRTAELYYNIGLVFYSKGPYAKAKLSTLECLRIRREICGNDSLLVASSLQLLGLLSTAIGDYEEAFSQLQEALVIRQKILGNISPNHLLILSVHLAIGQVYSQMGEFDKAMKSFSTVLMGRTIRLGKHHSLVAEALQMIGDAYIAINEYSKAAKTLEEALRLRKLLLGPMEVAETLNSLSLVYFCCDDTAHAIQLSTQSLKCLKDAVGLDHVLVAKVKKNLGDYNQSTGILDTAVEDYTESLRIMTIWKGRDHISLSELLNEIGVTYFKMEEFALAKESFTESLRIMQLSASDKSIMFPTLSHLGHALYKNKELSNAADTYLESFQIQVSIITGEKCGGLVEFSQGFNSFKNGVNSIMKEGGDSTELSVALGGIASILRYLGLVYHAQGDPEFALNVNKLSLSVRLCQPIREESAIAVMAETIAMFEFKRNHLKSALGYFNQALEAKKTVQGESTIDVARTVNNLANIHFSLGNLDDAMRLYSEAVEIKKRCLGEDSDDVANTLNNIAHVMVTAGKDQDALQAYHNVLKIRQEKYGKNHINVADTLSSMGDVYIKLGKLEIAKTYLEQVIRIRNIQSEFRDERVMENLASIYGKLGEWQKAEAAFKEILQLKRTTHGGDCIDVAKTLDLLAVSYIEQDQCEKSIEHLQEALRIRKVCLGADDDDVLASLNKLAFVYKSCNLTDKMLEVKSDFESIQTRRKHKERR